MAIPILIATTVLGAIGTIWVDRKYGDDIAKAIDNPGKALINGAAATDRAVNYVSGKKGTGGLRDDLHNAANYVTDGNNGLRADIESVANTGKTVIGTLRETGSVSAVADTLAQKTGLNTSSTDAFQQTAAPPPKEEDRGFWTIAKEHGWIAALIAVFIAPLKDLFSLKSLFNGAANNDGGPSISQVLEFGDLIPGLEL